jgi:predicted DNA-binding transcriptional regulator YafY
MSGKTNETLRRQWNILRLIPQEPRSITVNAICGALLEKHEKIERRNVERDLRSLLGTFDLQVDESEKPYLWSWRKDANFRFKPRLSDAESIALLLAQAHLSTLLPPQVQNDLRPWFQMAHRELSGGLWKENHQRTAVVPSSMPLQAPVLDDVVLQDVHQALARRRQLAATYRSKGAREGRRSVLHPLGLIVRGQMHYLACTFHGYDDVRQLALHRLTDTEVLTALSTEQEGFDLERYAANAGRYEAEGTAVLVARFSADAAEHLRETPLSEDQTLRDLVAENAVELSATVTLDQPLRWWLRAFGSQVQVLAPVSLREEMRADAEAAARAYADYDDARADCS